MHTQPRGHDRSLLVHDDRGVLLLAAGLPRRCGLRLLLRGKEGGRAGERGLPITVSANSSIAKTWGRERSGREQGKEEGEICHRQIRRVSAGLQPNGPDSVGEMRRRGFDRSLYAGGLLLQTHPRPAFLRSPVGSSGLRSWVRRHGRDEEKVEKNPKGRRVRGAKSTLRRSAR
jgi:hypothetical protein